ncbi:MAG TPA: hypothetical protein VNF92_00050 [Gemmatimonadaceae bacterium]|nr:hypothetical protein [Gemmatimonadaceae bacterium]
MAKKRSPADSLGATDGRPAAPSESPESSVSRRDFLVRAGQYGWTLSLAAPFLGRSLLPRALGAAPPRSAPPLARALADGIVRTAPVSAPVNPALFSGLRWRMLGPFRGGRTDAVTGVPGRPNEFYFGAVNGGLWKSIDAGRVWEPVFDDQPMASIGAVAVAPSAPDTVYVGSGECTLRDSVGYGNGIYKSTDGGRSWTHLGLADTQHIGKIAVHPHNPNIVFVAAIGHFYAPNPERGVFRSKDGGKTWQKVLFKNNDVGAIEVQIDPSNPDVVYAGLWNTRRPPWFVYAPSNGPGGGIYKSTDGGTTWKELTNGLPTKGMGKSGIAISASHPNRVYAVIDNLELPPGEKPPATIGPFGAGALGQGGFFRSDDGGAHWTKMSGDPALWGRGWYFEHVVCDPRNPDIVYVSNVAVSRTEDGGKTWVALRGSPGGDDYHQAWVSPDDPDTMVVASDQGTIITRNARTSDPREVTWSSWLNQPTAQMYHISVDYRFPYWVTGAQQDSGAVAVCVRGKFGEISTRDWEPIGAGGESGYTAGDPLHPGIIYGGTGNRFDLALNRNVPGTTAPEVPDGVKVRTDWTQPLVLSEADPRALYYANQYIFKSTDSAQTWTRISDDLTRPIPSVPPTLDEAGAADVDPTRGNGGVIYTVAPSPLLVPMIWIGTDDGLIKVTTDDGKEWRDVTPPALTPWSRVTMIEASHFEFNTAYASVDRHQLQDYDPYVYRTRDMGHTWEKITAGLPAGVYVHTVREDPERQGLLFAGTERGAFVSFDDGDHWQSLQLGLPTTSVRDFEIYAGDLIVGTHGRGIWVIDDISTLRQINDAVAGADAYLFKPANAYNYVQGGDNGTPLQKDEPQTPNPPVGAYIDYYLRSDAPGDVKIEVLDESGTVRATFGSGAPEAPTGGRGGRGGRGGGIANVSPLWQPTPEPFQTSAGMHRVVFNPMGGGRRGFGGGRGRGRGRASGPTPPMTGTFTARLTVNGKTYEQTFEMKADPRQME